MPMFSNTPSTQDSQIEQEETPVVTEPTDVVVSEEEVEEPNLPDVELIIEDGSGVANANCYCDLDFAMEYCTMKGYTDWQSLSETEQKVYLIRGTEFVDNFFTWKGFRRYKEQSMAFPRDEIYDTDHYRVEGIPLRLKKACLEAAWLNTTSGTDTLFTSKDINGKIKKQKVDALEVEYFNTDNNSSTSSSEVDYTSIYDILNKLLKGLYKTKTNGKVCTAAINTGW